MENEFIAWLSNNLPDDPRLRLGPGDDAAILDFAGHDDCVVTSDLLASAVHFDLDSAEPQRIARKAIAVNLSDLAAMASIPHSVIISLLLPQSGAKQLALKLFDGFLQTAREFDFAIAGGDTNCWDGPLVISVTAIGILEGNVPLLRSGAQPDDAILVTGELGGSILGRHYDFTPRIKEARFLRENFDLHAAIDISDGLSMDLNRLCQASGCGAVVHSELLPVSDAARKLALSPDSDKSSIDHALSDGEDFELLITTSHSNADRLLKNQPLDVGITRIGEIVSEPGLWRQAADGTRTPMNVTGYEHGTS